MFVNCVNCALAGKYVPPGFGSVEKRLCTRFSTPECVLWVELDDGCTFGTEGEPCYASYPVEVNIGNNAIVWG